MSRLFDNEPEIRRRRRDRRATGFDGQPALPSIAPAAPPVPSVPPGDGPTVDPAAEIVPYRSHHEDETSIRSGVRPLRPQDRFPAWNEILNTVLEHYTAVHRSVADAEEAQEESRYHEMVNEQVNLHPQWNVRQVDIDELVGLLRIYQFGYGALEAYMQLDDLEELYFNSYHRGFYIQHGQKFRIDERVFESPTDMRTFLDRVCRENGITLDRSHPNIDARLKDGSRLNATIEPLVDEADGPDFVIRKHHKNKFSIESYIRTGMISAELAEDLRRFVAGQLTIVVAGGTGSGKTTLLNTLCNAYLPPDDRLLILEANMRELQIETEDMKYFQTKEDPTRVGNANDITMRDLLRQTLRKRPDRIIVGEVRGNEAYYALRAWGSGHPGSFCTVHADDAAEALTTLEMLATGPGELSEIMIRRVIASSVDIVVHVERLRGRAGRRVTEVLQVLHPRKIDKRHPETRTRYRELLERGQIEQLYPGDDSVQILRLYELNLADELVRLAEPLRMRKTKIPTE
jgi:pilus assembly protein CpaF